MEMEIHQRAAALGALITGLIRRETHRGGPTIEAETTWSAPTLLFRLLGAGVPHGARLEQETAEHAIGAARLSSLIQRGLVRVSLGRVEPATSRRRELLERSLGKADLRDLEVLGELARKSEQGGVLISAGDVAEIYEAHQKTYASVPALAELTKPPTFTPLEQGERAGYILNLGYVEGGSWVGKAALHAGARLWTATVASSRKDADAHLLLQWLRKMETADGLSDTPRYLPREARERFLDAARDIVLSDASLGDFSEEASLQLMGQAASRELLPPHQQATSAGRYQWWEDFERATQAEPHDDARPLLNCLISAIVRYDKDDGGWHWEYRRVLDVLSAGKTKAYLAGNVPLSVRFNRPEAIAWLLTEHDTAALGLILLARLPIAEPSTMDSGEAREAREHVRRTFLFREGAALFKCFLSTTRPTSDEGPPPSPAMPILELLYGLAAECDRWADGGAQERARSRAEEIFSIAVASIGSAISDATTIVAGVPSYQPYLVAIHGEKLVDLASSGFIGRHVLAELKMQHAILRLITQQEPAFAPYPKETFARLRGKILNTIVTQHIRTLQLHKSGDSFSNYFRRPAFAAMPWEATACALVETGGLSAWLNVPDIKNRLREASDATDGPEGKALLSGCAARLRAHLEVLLAGHRGIRRFVGSPRAVREAATLALEKAIGELVLATTQPVNGTVDLFDRELALGQHEDIGTIASLAAKGIADFTAGSGGDILDEWVNRTSDPLVLLKIDAAIGLASTKNLIRARLADSTVLATADEEWWFDSLTQMVYDAAAADQREVTERLLARGDQATENHSWRARWDQAAFLARLLLAYHRGDSAAVDELALPKTAQGEGQIANEQRKSLEASRAFYQALLVIDTDPAKARASFEAQLAVRRDSAAILENIFAADLRLAKALANTNARRDAYELAIRKWDQTIAAYPRPDLLTVNGINTFIALDGAELDEEFDERWLKLSEDQRFDSGILQIRLESLKRRGMPEEVATLREGASARLGAELPDGKMDSSQSVVETRVASTNEDFRKQWFDIQGLPPHDLAAVVGGTRTRTIEDFILDVHVSSVRELMRWVPALDKIRDENKVNDLLGALVQMRVSQLGWTLSDQSRAGRTKEIAAPSTTASKANERDWVIRDRSGEFAIAEALRLESVDSAKIESHMVKLAGRYNPSGIGLTLVVVYFEGCNFPGFCERYRDHVETVVLPDWTRVAASALSESGNKVRYLRLRYEADGRRLLQDHLLIDLGAQS